MFKKIIVITTFCALTTAIALPAVAQEINDVEIMKEYVEAKFDAAKIAILKTLGKNMIQRRINALTAADNLLDDARLVADEVKMELSDGINDTITNLNSLKDDIDSEESIDALKAKVESIVTDFRVYVVQLPKAHGLAVVSHYRTMSVKLDEIIEKLEEKIDESSGDTGSAGSLVEEAKGLISSAASNLDQAEYKLKEMEIGWPSQANTLRLEARESILKAQEDLHDAFIKLKEAIAEIKAASAEEE